MKSWKWLRRELRERIVDSWDTTLTAVLICMSLVMWLRQAISTDEFITFLAGIATIITLLTKKKPME